MAKAISERHEIVVETDESGVEDIARPQPVAGGHPDAARADGLGAALL